MKRNLLLTTAAAVLLAAGAVSAAGPSPAGSGPAAQQQTQRSQDQSQDQLQGQSSSRNSALPQSMDTMEKLLGKTVVGSDGTQIGQVADIMLNTDTRQPNVAVIDAAGGKQVAIDFDLLDAQGERIVARTITRDQLAQMPEFQADNNMVSLNRNRAGQPKQ